MVEIKYFKDATVKDHESYTVPRVADFLKSGFTRDELQNMRFFYTDSLGREIDTEDGSFIDIDDGLIVVIDGRSLPKDALTIYIAVAVISAVVAIALAPDIPSVTTDTDTGSATNSLGESSNEARIGERIDDVFGTVAYHMPPLWQVPYRIGVNDREVEVLLCCVGRGKYDIDLDNVRDGDTSIINIPNGRVDFYEPGSHPGKGSPYLQIGSGIDQPIGIYSESNDLDATELLPPNDLSIDEAGEWTFEQDDTVTDPDGEGRIYATLTLTNYETLDVDLQDYFAVGSTLTMIDAHIWPQSPTTMDLLPREDLTTEVDIITAEYVSWAFFNSGGDMSGDSEIVEVTENTVSVFGDFNAATGVYDLKTGQFQRASYYDDVEGQTVNVVFKTDGDDFDGYFTDWDTVGVGDGYGAYEGSNPLTVIEDFDIYVDVGQSFSNIVGPFVLPDYSETALVNLSSANGFYNVYKGNNKEVDTVVRIVVEELDSNGDATGESTITDVDYSSYSGTVTTSVYRTYEIDIPYDYARIYARRMTSRILGTNWSNVDKIEWTRLYTYVDVDAANLDLGDVTLAHVYIQNNSQSRLTKTRKFNLDVTRKITPATIDSETGEVVLGEAESEAIDSFDQILIHTALDPYCGRLALSNINAYGLIQLRQTILDYFDNDGDGYANDMIRFGYDFDDNQVAYDDMFTNICDVVNCIPYVQNGIYDAFFEGVQDTSTMQITHRNKLADSETVEDIFEADYDGIELSYRNNETGTSDTIYVPDDGSATNMNSIDLDGCTTEIQAYRRALRLYNKQLYHTRNVEFDVDEIGRMIVPGQRIDSPDGTRFYYHEGDTDGYRVYDGEVVEINGLVVELSEPVYFTDGEDHYIQFTNTTGDNSELILCTEGDNEFEVVLASLPSDGLYDGYERDKTKYTFCSEQLRESIALIPKTIQSNIDNGQEVNTITSINYDARYYQGDTETLDD